jgi:dephospho-CoA kinase
MKYLKWMTKDKSDHDDFKFNIDAVTVANDWHPEASFDKTGGFNFTNEESALRWVSRGDTLYDVIIPKDAEVINVHNVKTPNGIFRTNKIIVTNPRKIFDDLTLELYKKSHLPDYTLFESLAFLALKGCYNTCLTIIRDKVTKENVGLAINEYIGVDKKDTEDVTCYEKVQNILGEIEYDLLISISISKKPYIKELTKDKIINLTGQSGSGKTYYAKEHFNSNKYLIIDTDNIFVAAKYENSSGIDKELGTFFRTKYKALPNLHDNFDLIYQDILAYCQKYPTKTIVIDCAEFHEVKDLNILKGKVIVIRTCIDECYKRCLSRWKTTHKNYTTEEFNEYANRKKAIYDWYKDTNIFLKNINNITALKEYT